MVYLFKIVITFIFIFFETTFAQNCSEKSIRFCQCKGDGDRYVVDCSHVGLKSVPKGIPVADNSICIWIIINLKVLKNGSFNQGKQRITTSGETTYEKM